MLALFEYTGITQWCALNRTGLHRSTSSPGRLAFNAKSSRELFTIGVLISHEFFRIQLGDLDIRVSESPGQVSDRRATSHHTDGKRVSERVDFAGIQVCCADIRERLGANRLSFVLSAVGYLDRRIILQCEELVSIVGMQVVQQHG